MAFLLTKLQIFFCPSPIFSAGADAGAEKKPRVHFTNFIGDRVISIRMKTRFRIIKTNKNRFKKDGAKICYFKNGNFKTLLYCPTQVPLLLKNTATVPPHFRIPYGTSDVVRSGPKMEGGPDRSQSRSGPDRGGQGVGLATKGGPSAPGPAVRAEHTDWDQADGPPLVAGPRFGPDRVTIRYDASLNNDRKIITDRTSASRRHALPQTSAASDWLLLLKYLAGLA